MPRAEPLQLRGIPGKPWRPIARTSIIIIIILRMRSACAEA